jgi:hypothetical protein
MVLVICWLRRFGCAPAAAIEGRRRLRGCRPSQSASSSIPVGLNSLTKRISVNRAIIWEFQPAKGTPVRVKILARGDGSDNRHRSGLAVIDRLR